MKYWFVLLILFTLVACSGQKAAEQRIVFMDSFRVFEEFRMKKDYDERIEREMGQTKESLDSLAARLEAIKDPVELARQKKIVFEAQQQFEIRFNKLSDSYTQEVYKRLNDYVRTYSQKEGYTLVLGTNGEGNVMYVDSTADITNALIRYVNREYGK